MLLRELFRARFSNILPIWYRKITINPSISLPIRKAPTQEILINIFSFIIWDLISIFIAFMVVLDSRTIKAKILNISFIILFWLNKRDNKIKNKPTIKIIISFFMLFLASIFSFSSKMVISGSTSLDFLLTYF